MYIALTFLPPLGCYFLYPIRLQTYIALLASIAITPPTGATTGVSIVPGSSTLTDSAYQPNPVQVNVGDSVTWTKDDSQPHTVTIVEGATPEGRFDSGIMAPGATFEHTFTEAGEYPYFCMLHPNMVGTVSVS
jgi:plastocyanin